MPRRKRTIVLILLLLLALAAGGAVAAGPAMGRWYIRSRLLPRLSRGLGRTVEVGQLEVGYSRVRMTRVRVLGSGGAALAVIPTVDTHYDLFSVLSGPLEVRQVLVERPRVSLIRRGDGSTNFLDLLQRTGAGGGGSLRIRELRLRGGTVSFDDRGRELTITASQVEGTLVPGGAATVRMRPVRLSSPQLRTPIHLALVELRHDRLRRASRWTELLPRVRVEGGQVHLFAGLTLSGIKGTIAPREEARDRLGITLSGSYGGAMTKLWDARGWIGLSGERARLRVRAERFSLGRIAAVLKRTPVILPQQTLVDGKADLRWQGGALDFGGHLDVDRLSLFHPMLARTPVLDLSIETSLSGKLDWPGRELVLDRLTVRRAGVEARVEGTVERIGDEPLVQLRLRVPRVPCQRVIAAFPPSLVPAVRGFGLRGHFFADIKTTIDFRKLSQLTLSGKLGLRTCKVASAPEEASIERLQGPFEHVVEVTPNQQLVFTVGPDNEDFVPYDQISPAMVKALLTTEDGGFFRHRGFIPSQMRKALARNLKRGGFRLGASTISMQMVKNVLLTHDKTLSRKLQELFLTWYLEQGLSKERIMEIYLNVIEFGPRIYGIGGAARHYFGQQAREITPLQAAFLASLLPSPKRRYVHYCRGALSPRWDRYVRRILRRMHARGHIDEAALAAADTQQIIFARDFDQLTEKECLDQLDELLEAWKQEKRDRLRQAVLRAAPHQLSTHLPPRDPSTERTTGRHQ